MVWVFAILGGAIAVILLIAATRPSTFRVERSATVAAPPETVFAHVDDFRAWRAWSPWEGLDPDMKRTYEGAERGAGAVYTWDGNKKAGAGRMEIVEAVPAERIVIKLDFTRPFSANNRTEFAFAPSGEGTHVTWTMTGGSPFMFRVIGVFMSMDKMIGRDFDRGLANLDRVVRA